MIIEIKHGIIKFPNSNHQPFVEYDYRENTVDILIVDRELIASIALGNSNYLIEERISKKNVWGPFIWNDIWGVDKHSEFFCYWDLNLATGDISYGYTPWNIIVSSSEPAIFNVGQIWYDLSTHFMYEWSGERWTNVCRLFCCIVNKINKSVISLDIGSQIGLSYPDTLQDKILCGYILYGIDKKGIRTESGEFLSTGSLLLTNHGSFSSPFKLEVVSTYSIASESIPAFYCVTNTNENQIGLASSTDVLKQTIGISNSPIDQGESGSYITHGIIVNDQWNWDFSNGKFLYCGNTGEIIQGPSRYSTGVIQKIGTILNSTTILINIEFIAETKSSSSVYTHIQSHPESSWIINHEKNSVDFGGWSVFDSDGYVVIPNQIIPIDNNSILVSFGTSTTGRASFSF